MLDQKTLDEFYGENWEYASKMFSLFLKNTPDDLASAREKLMAEDWAGFVETVHKIKPTFAMVGLPKLTEAAQALERKAEDQGRDQTEVTFLFMDFYGQVTSAMPLVEQQLEEYQSNTQQ
jgi:HPt (histidine-containing phosphotransfer) domain-containing protein